MNAVVGGFGEINKAAPEPIYQQIKRTIQHKIAAGEWTAGQKLPSENELVVALDVSRMTINRALRELTQQGLINRVHGLGSFIAETPRHASLIELQDIAHEIEQRGKRHTSRVLAQETVAATAVVAEKMGVLVAAPVYYLCAVHLQNDTPLQLEMRYVNPEAMPGFVYQDFTMGTSTAYLLKQFQPDEMEHIVRACLPDAYACEQLLMTAGEPCLQLDRRTWKNDQVITCVTLTYPGDRYDLGARYATNEYRMR
jgi:GntR family histidine utilization transcriptional repressor